MYNSVTLVGRLGADPEFDAENRPVRMSLATWRNVKDENEDSGWKQFTTWHKIDVWGKPEYKQYLAESFKKGDVVLVDGSIDISVYTNNEGEKKTSYRINATSVKIITRASTVDNSAKSSVSSKPKASSNTSKPKPIEDDDLPF